MSILMIHPRVEMSLSFRPDRVVFVPPGAVEAHTKPVPGWERMTVLEFLTSYDWRGSNKFQEEENLQFLRMYMDKYPEIAHHFEDIGPTEWETYIAS